MSTRTRPSDDRLAGREGHPREQLRNQEGAVREAAVDHERAGGRADVKPAKSVEGAYDKWSTEDLRAMARGQGVKSAGGLNREQLLAALRHDTP